MGKASSIHSCMLSAKDLLLWIEFKIIEYFQWNEATVLITKIEMSFVGMSANQLILSRMSALNRREQIINENCHKILFNGRPGVFTSAVCMLCPVEMPAETNQQELCCLNSPVIPGSLRQSWRQGDKIHELCLLLCHSYLNVATFFLYIGWL